MTKIGFVDLEILHLGIKGGGNFNEKDIEESNLKRLGVGRILDSLASLKDRKLIELNKDGSFSITDLARHILWDKKMPVWVKILRILEIRSFGSEEIAEFLQKSEQEVFEQIENLRKNQFVLMSPQRIDERIVKCYEILPEGTEKLKSVEKDGFEKDDLKSVNFEIEATSLLNESIKEINETDLTADKKEKIVSKLEQIKNILDK